MEARTAHQGIDRPLLNLCGRDRAVHLELKRNRTFGRHGGGRGDDLAAIAKAGADCIHIDAAGNQGRRRREHAPPVAAALGRRRCLRLCAVARDESLNLGGHRRGIADRIPGAAGGNRRFERAGSLDQQVHAPGGQRGLAVSQRAQVFLELVRQQFGLAMIDHPGQALERVKAAEEFFEHAGVNAALTDRALERKQRTTNRRQVLLGFGEIVVDKAVEKIAQRLPSTTLPRTLRTS